MPRQVSQRINTKRHTAIPVATLLLTLAAYAPAVAGAGAGDDLEATMTVLDDAADFDAALRRVDSPDDSAVEDGVRDDDSAADEVDDGFEYDEAFDEDDLEDEDDFEEGEDVDEDTLDP